MKNKFLTILLLLSVSFNIAHAYIIEVLDTHSCQIGEYVHGFHESDEAVAADDICHLHHFFHVAFILPEMQFVLLRENITTKLYTNNEKYEYNSSKNFLKPPINV